VVAAQLADYMVAQERDDDALLVPAVVVPAACPPTVQPWAFAKVPASVHAAVAAARVRAHAENAQVQLTMLRFVGFNLADMRRFRTR
jgi:hypothetical protein